MNIVQIVAEIRQGSKKDLGAVMKALEAVRRSVIDESGLFPSRVVSVSTDAHNSRQQASAACDGHPRGQRGCFCFRVFTSKVPCIYEGKPDKKAPRSVPLRIQQRPPFAFLDRRKLFAVSLFFYKCTSH